MPYNIVITVSDECESTSYPWWVIIDPQQNMSCDIHFAAGQITGPFFSRQDAKSFFTATRYNFSKRAHVYCLSGYHARQYRNAIDAAKTTSTSATDPLLNEMAEALAEIVRCLSHGLQDCRASITAKAMLQKYNERESSRC